MRTKIQWTVCILSSNLRKNFLFNLINSFKYIKKSFDLNIVIVNKESTSLHNSLKEKIIKLNNVSKFNIFWSGVNISEGRNFLLNLTKTKFVLFIDDDVSFNCDVVKILENSLSKYPFALTGMKSYISSTNKVDKPKKNQYPYFEFNKDVVFGPVFGIIVGGYTKLIKKVGGFDKRRRNWGEWVDLNLRLLNKGFLVGHNINKGYVRHWLAPGSPTRDKEDRQYDIIKGIILTSFQYNLLSKPNTPFWKIVFNRYLNYAYDSKVTKEKLFFDTLNVFRDLIINEEIPMKIDKTYKFSPYENIDKSQWLNLFEGSKKKLTYYKK